VSDRRVILDRRSDESTARWLDGIDKRRSEFRFGRRDTDQAVEVEPKATAEELAFERQTDSFDYWAAA
jgi:hypothetical protein